MGFLESPPIAVQDGDQIDNGIMTGQQSLELSFIMDIGFDDIHQREHLNRTAMNHPAGRNGCPDAQTVELFADMSAEKAGTTQNENFFHVLVSAKVIGA